MEQKTKFCPLYGAAIDCNRCQMLQLQTCMIKQALRSLPRIVEALDDLGKLDYIQDIADRMKEG